MPPDCRFADPAADYRYYFENFSQNFFFPIALFFAVNILNSESTTPRNGGSTVRRVSYAAGVAIVATAFVLLAACQQPTTTPTVSTTKWASDGNGNIEFITNDSANYGYGYWETFLFIAN